MIALPSLAIVIASTRPTRVGPLVGRWFHERTVQRGIFEVDLVDLAEVNLPLFNEPKHPRLKQYKYAHTKAWSARVERADAFAFVTPEYNYGAPPSLVNAIDYLMHEWAYKPVGFVSYGGVAGGTRSVQMTKLIVTALKMMPLPEAVIVPFIAQHIDKDTGTFMATEAHEKAADVMLAELRRWAEALRSLRPA